MGESNILETEAFVNMRVSGHELTVRYNDCLVNVLENTLCDRCSQTSEAVGTISRTVLEILEDNSSISLNTKLGREVLEIFRKHPTEGKSYCEDCEEKVDDEFLHEFGDA